MKKIILALITILLALTATAQDSLAIAKSDSLVAKAEELSKAKQYDEAIKHANEALEVIENEFGKEDYYYAVILTHLSNIYSLKNNHKEAFWCNKEALRIIEMVRGKDNPDYILTLFNLGISYYTIKNFKESIRHLTEYLKLTENDLNKNMKVYSDALSFIALCYNQLGIYNKAIIFDKKALSIIKEEFGNESKYYATSLNNLAADYSSLGNYKEAIKYANDALTIREKVHGTEHLQYTNVLNNLATYYANLGRYPEAIKLATKVLQKREKQYGKLSSRYANTLYNLSGFYSEIFDYNKAIKLATEALITEEHLQGKESSEYATYLCRLAECYLCIGDNTKAFQLSVEALQIINRVLGREHPKYAKILSRVANCNYNIKNVEEAINQFNEVLKIEKKIYGENHPQIAKTLSCLSECYNNLENFDDAVNFGLEALQIIERTIGKNNRTYAQLCNEIASYYFNKGNLYGVEMYMNLFFEIIPSNIKNDFNILTEKERDNYWGIFQSKFMEEAHRYVFRNQSSKLLVENGCNAVLMGKGLLLSTSQELNNLITESGDGETKTLYDELMMSRLMLDRLYEKPIAERKLSTDSLEQVANDLEHQLIDKSKAYGDFTRNLSIKWQDVQKAMKSKDVCIEFVSFPLKEDSTMYVAYVNKPGIDCPIYVPLFEEKQLKAMYDIPNDYSSVEAKALAVADIYRPEQRASELIWKPLAQHLDGAEHVYFAPSGELYNIAIESLPDWESSKRLMSDRWPGLCRLSSTREIAINRERQPINTSVTYGGLKYGMDSTLLIADSKKYGSNASSLESSNLLAQVKGDTKGGLWNDMPITLDEAASVHESLNKAGVNDTPYLEEAGTEASFNALSGQHKNMMFLSTHGFFWNIDEATKHRNEHTLQFISLGDEKRSQSVEDVSLTHSGLLFSGANYAWQGNELPEGVDDGFLTAKEISQLDLRGLELVVLSACQTGLGDVSGEGVFGLQRGFKKAGAQSILMSLWEVNAYSTKLLMTEFCKNVFEKNMPKRDALRAAQETVKNFTGDPQSLATKSIKIGVGGITKEQKNTTPTQQTSGDKHPFAHPYYWAGFILLDALD